MSSSSFISFQRLPYEPEWHVEITASNGYFSGVQDFYTHPEDLKILGTKFRDFPQNLHDEVILRLGEKSDKYAYFLLVRAFLYNSVGHAAIEFAADNNLKPPHQAQTNFFILTEVAAINQLGQQLLNWIVANDSKLLWLARTRA